MDVGARAAARRSIMPAADRRVGERSIRMKPPVVAVVGVGIEGDRRGRREIAEADLVESSSFAASLSRVLTSIRCLSSVTVAGRRACADLHADRSGRAAAAPRSSRQMCAANWSATSGRRVRLRQHVAARDVDLVGERQRHRVAGLGRARDRRRRRCARRVLSRPEAATTISSPGATAPLAIVPAKPRKSRCGRLTHCTGMRKGALRRSSSTSIASRDSRADAGRDTRACAR